MKKDISYILKRILIGLGIALALMFIKGSFVHAQTYNVSNDGSYVKLFPSNTSQSISFGSTYQTGSSNGLNQIYFKFALPNDLNQYNMLQAGSYLFDFYIVSDNLDTNLSNCKDFDSDYRFIDKTSGSTISAASASKSTCINSFYVNYSGKNAIHYLIQYTITDTASYPYMTDELDFRNYLWHGQGFLQYNSSYSIYLGNIVDYDSSIVSDFNNSAGQKAIQSSIDYQTQVQHQDSVNTQNIINDDNVSGASSEVDSLINNAAFSDTSGINAIINAPLNFIQNLSSTCQPIQITIPYIDTSVTIPCIYQTIATAMPGVAAILSVAINGFIIYRILLDIVSIVKSAREPDEDRIEVLDL